MLLRKIKQINLINNVIKQKVLVTLTIFIGLQLLMPIVVVMRGLSISMRATTTIALRVMITL